MFLDYRNISLFGMQKTTFLQLYTNFICKKRTEKNPVPQNIMSMKY